MLTIRELIVDFNLGVQMTRAVNRVNLSVNSNETVVLAGESGSGKTITALAVTKLLPDNAKVVYGSIEFLGQQMLSLNSKQLCSIRGKDIAYIFQEPASYLNPVYTIGEQIVETIMLHQHKSRHASRRECLELLHRVKINDPQRVYNSYAHQLSGGMNQRSLIAMALACQPKLLIADEPTTALDVTIEKQILDLLQELKKQQGFSLLFITHNLALAGKIADRICIMYQGQIVEQGSVEKIFKSPEHSHTRELIAAYERIGRI